jgi:hypothetical protein
MLLPGAIGALVIARFAPMRLGANDFFGRSTLVIKSGRMLYPRI